MASFPPPEGLFTFQFGIPSGKGVYKFEKPKATPSDPFSRLFPDVAILIFEELARIDQPNTLNLGWMRAAQVNSLWRATILKMPTLWARDFLARGYQRGLEHYLTLTQDCPLTLDLRLPRGTLDMRRLWQLLPRANKILRSGTKKPILRTLEVLRIRPLPGLEEVSLLCHERNTVLLQDDYLAIHPGLRSVNLRGCITLIPGHITALSISLHGRETVMEPTSLSRLLDTLAQTPRLVELTVQFPEFVRIGNIPFRGLPEHTYHLPVLEKLILGDPSDITSEAVPEFLHRICAPSLARVHLTTAYKYTYATCEEAETSRNTRDVMRQFRSLLTYFGGKPCACDSTSLAMESLAEYPNGLKTAAWPDTHNLTVRLERHSPTHTPEGSRSLAITLRCKHNPRQAFPLMTSRALEIAGIPVQNMKELDLDLSFFDELPKSVESLFRQCSNVEKIVVCRRNDHESAQALVQALIPSTLTADHALRQLPFHLESEPEVYLPCLRTIELPNSVEGRIHFVELLSARYTHGAPVHLLIIPGQDLEQHEMVEKAKWADSIRSKVLARLRHFAEDIGATMSTKDTSPQGRPTICPTEIRFLYQV